MGIVSFFGSLYAQPIFQKSYAGADGVDPSDIIQTSDGGFLISGNELVKISLYSYNHPILIKTDSIANVIWSYSYGGGNDDNSQKLLKTNDGNYLMVGGTNSYGPFGIGLFGDSIFANTLVIKTDSIGTILWSYTYGDTLEDNGAAVVEAINGDFIITGQAKQYGFAFDNSGDILVLRITKDGQLRWSRTIESTDSLIEAGANILPAPDGGFYISGLIDSYNSYSDAFLIKIDSLGDVVWSKRMGELTTWYTVKMVADGKGGVVIGFSTYRFNAIYADLILAEFDLNGNKIWVKRYGNASGGDDDITALQKLSNQRGYIWASSGRICMIDTVGTVIWSRNSSTFFGNSILKIIENQNHTFDLIGADNVLQNASVCFIQIDSAGNNCDGGSFYIYPNSACTIADTVFEVLSIPFIVAIDSGCNKNYFVVSDSSFCNGYTGIEQPKETNKFNIFPNPLEKEFFINSTFDLEKCQFSFYNQTGNLVFSLEHATSPISMEGFPSGFFILKITYNKFAYYYKLLKIE